MTTISVLFKKNESPQFSYATTGGTPATNVTITASEPIYWTINSNSDPATFSTGVSPHPPGIVFLATGSRPDEWQQNNRPTGTETQWSVNDSVSDATKGTFAYRVNLLSPGGTLYSHDPDVTNSPQ